MRDGHLKRISAFSEPVHCSYCTVEKLSTLGKRGGGEVQEEQLVHTNSLNYSTLGHFRGRPGREPVGRREDRRARDLGERVHRPGRRRGTGVRRKHTTSTDNFRADHGWYDAYNKTVAPNDDYGHGTHVAGPPVGAGGVGVSPWERPRSGARAVQLTGPLGAARRRVASRVTS